MVKPDGVQRRLSGEIIRRFENRGLKLVALKMLTPSRETAEKHYEAHKERTVFWRARRLCHLWPRGRDGLGRQGRD